MVQDDTARFQRRLGTELCGKWTLQRLLGVGGMAAVYKARHRIGTEAAIKILHPEVAQSPELRARFEREAKVCGELKHAGAVEVRDVDVGEDGAPFMVMELLTGESLGDRLKRLDNIPAEDALRYVDELLDVLVAAHAQGFIHRDIKLDNLFITSEGPVKVLDFGIAQVREAQPMTVVGARLGTLPYMPPEQVRGQEIDPRADLFSVGAVLFRVLTKRRIHEAKTEPEMLALMSTTPAPPVCSVAPSIASDLGLVVDRALAFDRERRYPDAATMRGDIQAVQAEQPPPYATRLLSEQGPPNRTGDAAEPPPTRVGGASAAPVVVGDAGPMSATAAASPQASDPGPMSATAAATPQASEPGPTSSTAAATPGQLGNPMSQTATATPFGPGSAIGPGAVAEPTAVSAAGAARPVAEPTQVSAGLAATSQVPSPASHVAPAAAVASERKGPPIAALAIGGGVLLLLLVIGLAVALSGSEAGSESSADTETDVPAAEVDDETASSETNDDSTDAFSDEPTAPQGRAAPKPRTPAAPAPQAGQPRVQPEPKSDAELERERERAREKAGEDPPPLFETPNVPGRKKKKKKKKKKKN